MGKTVALVIAILLVLVFGTTLFALQTRHQREMTGVQQLLQKQEEELGILRADNAYLKSQTTEIGVLEEDLANKRTEIEGLKKRGEEQQEMMSSFEERLAEFSRLQEQVDQLKQENDRLRLEAEKKAVEGLEPASDLTASMDESLSGTEEKDVTDAGEAGATMSEDAGGSEESSGEVEPPSDQGEGEPLTFPGKS